MIDWTPEQIEEAKQVFAAKGIEVVKFDKSNDYYHTGVKVYVVGDWPHQTIRDMLMRLDSKFKGVSHATE